MSEFHTHEITPRWSLADHVLLECERLRDIAKAEYHITESDPYLIKAGFDPGDSYVNVNGNPVNVLRILSLLEALGVPGTELR